MARIGLIEISCAHHELATLCKISDNVKHDITVFTTKELYQRVIDELKDKDSNYEWIIKKTDENIYYYIKITDFES